MIYLPNVFLLNAIKQLHSCVFEESIIKGYSLKSFRKNVAFFTHHQEMDDEFGFFGENIITLSLPARKVWLTMYQVQTGRCKKIVIEAN